MSAFNKSFSKLRPRFLRQAVEEPDSTLPTTDVALGEDKTAAATSSTQDPASLNKDPELPTEDAQRGVQQVEAVTLTWSKKSLVAVFILYVLRCLFKRCRYGL